MNGPTRARLRVVIALFVGLAAIPAAPARAPDPLLPKDRDDVNASMTGCLACHNNQAPINPKLNLFAKRFRSHEFIRLDEGQVWLPQDPHGAAFTALGGPLGKQMAKALKYDVTKAPACLTCHATDKSPTAPLPANTGAEKEVAQRFETAEGVTCAACHGLRKDWQAQHHAEKAAPDGAPKILWRLLAPAKKEEAGMRNVRDPVVVGRLCATCHVGSPEEGKVLTHDMYAAGHPPLPPFEIVTFVGGMPRHRNYPTDPQMKFFTPEGFKEYAGEEFASKNKNWTWDLYRFHPADKEVYLTRHVVAGAVAALEAEMNLLRAFAKTADKDGGLDMAAFACSVCHLNPAAPGGKAPGRVPLKREYAALAVAAAEHAGQSFPALDSGKELRKKLAALDGAAAGLNSKPGPIGDAAADLAKACAGFQEQLSRADQPLYAPPRVRELWQAVSRAADEQGVADDPTTAAHLLWAYLALRSVGGDPVPADKLKALGEVLPVRVRGEPYSTKDGDPVLAGESARARLELFGKFQPEKFRKALRDTAGGAKRP